MSVSKENRGKCFEIIYISKPLLINRLGACLNPGGDVEYYQKRR